MKPVSLGCVIPVIISRLSVELTKAKKKNGSQSFETFAKWIIIDGIKSAPSTNCLKFFWQITVFFSEFGSGAIIFFVFHLNRTSANDKIFKRIVKLTIFFVFSRRNAKPRQKTSFFLKKCAHYIFCPFLALCTSWTYFLRE